MAFSIAVLSAVLFIGCVFAAPTPLVEGNEVLEVPEEDGWTSAARMIRECDKQDVVACLGAKAVGYLDRASRMGNFEIYDGIVLVGNVDRSGRAMTDNEIESDVETSPDGKAYRILDLIAESVSRFFKTHYLELKMPESVQESLEEGRQRVPAVLRPGHSGNLRRRVFRRIIPLLLAGKAYLTALVSKLGLLFVGKIALKAVILAKIALGIGAFLLYRSKMSPEHGHSHTYSGPAETAYQSSSSSSGWGGPYQRSFQDAHQLAYAAQEPEPLKFE